MPHHLEYLNRENYIDSIESIEDTKTLKFANMCLNWWDKQFGWYSNGCIALSDEKNDHLCYIFFKIDRYKEYITIHNIFTPFVLRRNGYAYELLKAVFEIALDKYVKRFKLSCISKSLDFYLSLGFIYWGVNRVGDYYCDLPLPQKGLDGVEAMVKSSSTAMLIGKKFDTIYNKVADNETHFNCIQNLTYKNDMIKMGEHYLLEELLEIKT